MQQDLMTRLDSGAPQVSSRSADPSSGGNSSSSSHSPSSSAVPKRESQQFPSWSQGAPPGAPQPVTPPLTPAQPRFQPRPEPQPNNNSTPEVRLASKNIHLLHMLMGAP